MLAAGFFVGLLKAVLLAFVLIRFAGSASTSCADGRFFRALGFCKSTSEPAAAIFSNLEISSIAA